MSNNTNNTNNSNNPINNKFNKNSSNKFPEKFPEISYEKSYINSNFKKIFLFNEIQKQNNHFGYKSLFFWSKDPSILNTLEGKMIGYEINLILPKDEDQKFFSQNTSEKIHYSKYYIKELISFLRFSINHYDTISPNFKKFLFFRQTKKIFFDPICVFITMKMCKDVYLIFRERKLNILKRKIFSLIICYFAVGLISMGQKYMEFSYHYKFFEEEILKPINGKKFEEDYSDYCTFKKELMDYENYKNSVTYLNHTIDIEEDRKIKVREKEEKVLF